MAGNPSPIGQINTSTRAVLGSTRGTLGPITSATKSAAARDSTGASDLAV
jgi:hypothetical protein